MLALAAQVTEPLAETANSVIAKAISPRYVYQSAEEPTGWFYGRIRLSWTRQNNTPIDGFRIFRLEYGVYEQIAETTRNTFVDGDIECGDRHSYRVRPFTYADGNQASLGTASAVTNMPATGGYLGCETDGSIQATGTSDAYNAYEFRFEWGLAGSDESSFQSKEVDADWEGGAVVFPYAKTVISGLNPFKEYVVRITAHNSMKDAEPYIQTIKPLAIPYITETVVRADGSVRVLWAANTTHATTFQVDWRIAGQKRWGQTKSVSPNDRSTILKQLIPHRDYEVRVITIAGDILSEPAYIETVFRP